MSTNLRSLFLVSLLFGIATGIYEFILPLFFDKQHISLANMGIIFAVAGLAMLLARLYLGGLSDHWGRKPLYGWALALCGGMTLLVPLLPSLLPQIFLKMVRDTAALTRETLHPVILYEEWRDAFLGLIGKFRGMEFLLQAGGTLLAGVLLVWLGNTVATFQLLLLVAGGILLLAAAWWGATFREQTRNALPATVTLRSLFSLDLHPNLLLLAVSGIIFSFGIQLSHSFYLPLFFKDRFHMLPYWISVVMVLHRLTIALPLLLAGNLPLKNLRAWYIWGLIVEGVTMAGCAIIPHMLLSTAIFLLHDLVGAGIWVPIQATLTQRFSRDATRGLEVGKVLAWSSIGGILGPLTAGWIAGISPILPFLFSGIVMALAAIPLVWIEAEAKPLPAQVETAAV